MFQWPGSIAQQFIGTVVSRPQKQGLDAAGVAVVMR